MAAKKQDLATIEAQLAEEAKTIGAQLSSADGKKITIDPATGNFVGPGQENMGTTLRGVIIEFCSSHKYYDRPYSADNAFPPICFAFGQTLAEMAPEEESPEPQNDMCGTPGQPGCCPHNEWGSAANEKGKACQQRREFAFVLEEDLAEGHPTLYHMSTPPTSIKYFDAAAATIARQLNGPPIKAMVTITAVPTKNYFSLNFSDIDANTHLAACFPLREAATDLISRFPDTSKYVPLTKKKGSK
jgi:hypothetical protein